MKKPKRIKKCHDPECGCPASRRKPPLAAFEAWVNAPISEQPPRAALEGFRDVE